jgi:hypothetical protein
MFTVGATKGEEDAAVIAEASLMLPRFAQPVWGRL